MLHELINSPFLVLCVSALVEALWMLAVGRELERNGKFGAFKGGIWIAGFCMLLPVYMIAAGMLLRTMESLLVRSAFPVVLATGIAPPLLLAGLCAIVWRSPRPAVALVLSLVLTAPATWIIWTAMTDMYRWKNGTPVVVGFSMVPCAIWHLISGPWLMSWAHDPALPAGVCLKCRYDLAGLPNGAPCPECGTARSTWPDPPRPSQTANATVIQTHSEPAHSPPTPDSM